MFYCIYLVYIWINLPAFIYIILDDLCVFEKILSLYDRNLLYVDFSKYVYTDGFVCILVTSLNHLESMDIVTIQISFLELQSMDSCWV